MKNLIHKLYEYYLWKDSKYEQNIKISNAEYMFNKKNGWSNC